MKKLLFLIPELLWVSEFKIFQTLYNTDINTILYLYWSVTGFFIFGITVFSVGFSVEQNFKNK